MNVIFYISAIIAIIATAMAITRANAVHALLYVICSLLATGVMFFVLGAPFAAALTLIINAGAIMVLFVFIVMMLNIGPQSAGMERTWLRPPVWIGPGIIGVVLIVELAYILLHYPQGTAAGQAVEAKQVGMSLFGPYLLAVELASMLLLVGLLGAYHLGRGVMKSPGASS
jgi:NADH-quinone oxidoreductase subunit J